MHFVFDVDGTTSFNGMTIEPEVCEAFRRLIAAGHTVVLASARPIRDILPMLPADLKDITCIGANGALIYEDGEVRVRAVIDAEAFNRVRELILEHTVDFVADSSRHYAYSLPHNHFLIERIDVNQLDTRVEFAQLKRATKVMMLNITDRALHQFLHDEVSKLKVEVAEHDDPTGANIDLTAAGVHKQAALTELLDGAPYIAFGNDTNDIEMLQGASYAVAVGPKEEIIALGDTAVDARGQAVAHAIDVLVGNIPVEV
ncbi:HAD-IIB family hydrolase [Rothia sp. ZJ932]|uniref:HAD-IIB family hydrolase n=1 Tax=Rothia sp. ZJ932 TaxID=2810516 RepID=UPI001967C609|nr:HAD-IIB family hydrolase [Rothia sp. ZJ932]QRZ61417.1 HAD-IIB family hydrolase [Rothia sp. ZJ932]